MSIGKGLWQGEVVFLPASSAIQQVVMHTTASYASKCAAHQSRANLEQPICFVWTASQKVYDEIQSVQFVENLLLRLYPLPLLQLEYLRWTFCVYTMNASGKERAVDWTTI